MIFSYFSLAAFVATISFAVLSNPWPTAGATDSSSSSRMVNITISSSSANRTQVALPPNIIAYMPIHISNTQPTATQAPFEQLVYVDSSNFYSNESPNLQNVEFFDARGDIVPSWLESGNSNTAKDTVYWLKINTGIAPSSTLTVYMGFATHDTTLFNNVTTGEAPQLSPVYGQYDNGRNVFRYYQSFGNIESMPAGWSTIDSQGGNMTNSSCRLSFSSDHISLGTGANSSSSCAISAMTQSMGTNSYPLAVDVFGSLYSSGSGNYAMMGYFADSAAISSELSGNSGSASYALKVPGFTPGSGMALGIRLVNSGVEYESNYDDLNSSKVYSIYVQNGHSASLMTGHIAQYESDRLTQTPVEEFGIASHGGQQSPTKIYWIDSRAYPPLGSMPLVSLGAMYYKSTTLVECLPSKIVLGSTVRCTAEVSGYSPNQGNPLSTQVYPNGTLTWSGDEQHAFLPSYVCTLANGTCSVTYTPTTVLTTAVKATYGGDVYNDKSTGSFALGIERAHTFMSAFCLPSPVSANSSTTCNAVVRGNVPSGPVMFTSSSPTGTFTPSSGQCVISVWGCSITYTDSNGGNANISASYGGDVSNMPAASATVLTVTGSTNVPEFSMSTLSLAIGLSAVVAFLAVLRSRQGKEKAV